MGNKQVIPTTTPPESVSVSAAPKPIYDPATRKRIYDAFEHEDRLDEEPERPIPQTLLDLVGTVNFNVITGNYTTLFYVNSNPGFLMGNWFRCAKIEKKIKKKWYYNTPQNIMTDLKINDLDYSAKFCIMRIPKSPKFIVDGGFYDSASGYDMECVMVTGKTKTGTPDILYTSDKCPLVVKEFPHYNENCVVLVFPENCKFKGFKVDVEHLLIPVMEELGGLWISKKHIVTFKDTDFLFYYTDCAAGSW